MRVTKAMLFVIPFLRSEHQLEDWQGLVLSKAHSP